MFEIDKAQFGAFVAAQRKKKGYTQKELAQKLYVSDKAVSKWERGISTPDIALLIPLADCLGVTVTELLEGRELEPAREPETEQAEKLVRRVLDFSEEEARENAKQKGRHALVFFALAAVMALELAVLAALGYEVETMMKGAMGTSVIFIAAMSAYVWIGMKERLPACYDQVPTRYYTDGLMQMSIRDLYYNNRNWPHILRILRGWSVFHAVLVGPFYFVLAHLATEPWRSVGNVIWILLFLGGLFIPTYAVGKRYE